VQLISSADAADQAWLAQLSLKDGRRVCFRPVRPEDQPLIAEAIRTSSRQTLYHRFFSPLPRLSPETLRAMLAIDRTKEACLVGVVESAGVEKIVCGARYVRLSRADTAEIALTVHDTFQRLGLGTFLLKRLVDLARNDGIHWFDADVLASNTGMLKLLRKLFPSGTEWQRTGNVYHVRVDLAAAK
jgi:acetyltransferase